MIKRHKRVWILTAAALLCIPLALFYNDILALFKNNDTPAAKALRVNGNKIEYGTGDNYTPVTLRGVNVGDPFHIVYQTQHGSSWWNADDANYRPEYPDGFKPDYQHIANTINANAVRYVFLSKWMTLGDEVKTAAVDYLVTNVKLALDAGMFVIIDYHTVGYPNGYTESEDNGLYFSDFSLASEFWDIISKKDFDGRVLFELWNEPASNDYGYLDSADTINSHWTELKGWWEQLIAVIRSNGAGNIIIAAADYWTGDLRGVKNGLISGSNIAYSWHRYGKNGNNTIVNWEARLDGLYDLAPILVTEWGYDVRPDTQHYSTKADFADKFIPNILEKHGLHSFAWSCDPWYTPSMWVSSEKYLIEYNEFGQVVADYLNSFAQIRPDISNC